MSKIKSDVISKSVKSNNRADSTVFLDAESKQMMWKVNPNLVLNDGYKLAQYQFVIVSMLKQISQNFII